MANAPTGYILSEKNARDILRIIHKVDTMRGPGVINNDKNISIMPPQQPSRKIASAAKLPTPQYQWMVLGSISQNQLGAFFTPAVSMSMS